MAQLVEIQQVEVGRTSFIARVRIADSGPLMTSDDLVGTTRIYRLMPHIIDHVCMNDGGETFKDVMGNTELAHLLEHMTVELLAQTDIAGDITAGRTYEVEDDPRAFEIEVACPDDVLVAGALSSAAWMMQWAYSGGGEPEPSVEATVQGLVGLVNGLPEEDMGEPERVVVEEEDDEVPEDAPQYADDVEEVDATEDEFDIYDDRAGDPYDGKSYADNRRAGGDEPAWDGNEAAAYEAADDDAYGKPSVGERIGGLFDKIRRPRKKEGHHTPPASDMDPWDEGWDE